MTTFNTANLKLKVLKVVNFSKLQKMLNFEVWVDEIPELETSFKAMGRLIHKAFGVVFLLLISRGDGPSFAVAEEV